MSIAVVGVLFLAPFASANPPYRFTAPYNSFNGAFSSSHTGTNQYAYQYENGYLGNGTAQMSQQADGGNASCGGAGLVWQGAEMSQYANFTTPTFTATPGSVITIGATWSWVVWTLGHVAYSCGGLQDNGYAYVHANLGIVVSDAHTGLPVGSYGKMVWSQALLYNYTGGANYFPYPNGAAWLVNESMSNYIISSSFTLGGTTSGSYFVTPYVWVFTAASLEAGSQAGDTWVCADGYAFGSTCSGMVVPPSGGGWTLNQVTVS